MLKDFLITLSTLVIASLASVSRCVMLLLFGIIFGISTYKHAGKTTFVEKVRPDSITDIADFLRRFPERERIYQSDVGGQRYVIVLIPPPDVAGHFPSGPPAYVFDSDKLLVDWSTDIGDDEKIWKKWLLASARQLNEREFMSYIEQSGRGNRGIGIDASSR